MKCDTITEALCVSTPLRDSIITNLVCRNCMLKNKEAQLRVDLVVILLREFNVILGMYWLSEYHVILNYFSREVKINSPERLATMFHREK